MAYDDVVSLIEVFGPYQRRIYFLLCLPIISVAFHTMAGVFLAAKPDFRCLLPHESSANATYHISPDIAGSPAHPFDGETINDWPRCERYNGNLTDQDYEYDKNDSLASSISKCDSFVYDKSIYELTTTTEFDLVCDKQWLRTVSESVFMVGVMIGAIIFGSMSDKFGRKPVYFSALVIHSVSALLVAVSPQFISFMILRMILAAASTGIFSVSYVIVVEMISPENRLLAVTGIYIAFSSGYILVAGFAYFIRNWRILQIAITVPSLAFLLYWWFIPESVRWSLTNDRMEEAKELLLKSSIKNGLELSRNTLDSTLLSESRRIKPEKKRTSMFDLLKYPNLRRKSLLLFFIWFVNSGTYYGLSWNTSNLGGNDFINAVISAAVELPAHMLLLSTLNRWGRKIVLCGCLLFAGTSLLMTTIVPKNIPWLVVALAMLGKSAITASFGSVYVFTTEQYPTIIRNIGLGACSTFSRLAGLVVPYINYTSTIWKPMPLVIWGSGSLMAGLLVIFLPETLNEKLPETIGDGEQLGKAGDIKLKEISRN